MAPIMAMLLPLVPNENIAIAIINKPLNAKAVTNTLESIFLNLTDITGISNFSEGRTLISNRKLRILITSP